MKYIVTVADETFEVEVGPERRVWINHRAYDVDLQNVDGLSQYSLLVDHCSYEAHVEQTGEDESRIVVDGRSYQVRLEGKGRRSNGRITQSDRPSGPLRRGVTRAEVRAPLPGLLVEMRVREGEHVEEQDVVAVLESMKMNLELRAPRSGVVQALPGTPGAEIDRGDVLAVIGPGDSFA